MKDQDKNWAYLWQNKENGIIKLYGSAAELQKAQGISSYTLQDLIWMKLSSIQLTDHIEVRKVPVSNALY